MLRIVQGFRKTNWLENWREYIIVQHKNDPEKLQLVEEKYFWQILNWFQLIFGLAINIALFFSLFIFPQNFEYTYFVIKVSFASTWIFHVFYNIEFIRKNMLVTVKITIGWTGLWPWNDHPSFFLVTCQVTGIWYYFNNSNIILRTFNISHL